MGCLMKKPNDPFEVQCLFPEHTEEFSLYFHSSGGQQELIADCVYKEKHDCYFTESGFNMTHDDDNVLTIAVADTIWKQTGRFLCQKGGQLLNVSCQFPSEHFISGNSTTSEDGLITRENFTLNNSLISQASKSMADNNPGVIGTYIGVAVSIMLILVITVLLLKKYNSKKHFLFLKKCTKGTRHTWDFQRQISGESNGSGNSATPFLQNA
ncbi:uncharacterized protein LOC112569072 isoform X2 [Pomacea canaliculata]|uniref:uncharacterized protein LOC112569072 isoform X2 n=1 Tax=Pomacea canaliculata TaxID=400727 RepID=UPI000D72E738|nr:uncharacterized protein LOC112569072 isoform X2 [Pomacea canaliculata]